MPFRKRTVTARLYSIGIRFIGNGREIFGVDPPTSLEFLASYENGVVPALDIQQKLFMNNGRARIAKIYYALPNGEAIEVSFPKYVALDRPLTIKVPVPITL